MSKLPIRGNDGRTSGEYEIADSLLVFDKGAQAVKDAIVRYQANHRQGSASTKNKGEVAGSNRKLWAQKGTGRARTGLRQSPIWRGGGVAFGPRPRSFAKDMPKQVARLAFRRALSDKIASGSVTVVGAIDDATTPHSIVGSIARFFEREACGQCPPCVLGTANLRQLVTGDRPPTIRLTPQVAMREAASFMMMHGYCSHARAGASAVTKLFALWQDEVLGHLRGEALPSGARERDPFAPGSAERGALEAFLEGV